MPAHEVRVGCAGWSIPKGHAEDFPGPGSHLERYARRFPAVEINSSFHRPHRPSTYARWRAATPEGFAFSAKVPKEVTHTRRLVDAGEPLARFLDESSALGEKRGPLLVQLPPSLAFDPGVAASFFRSLRDRGADLVACEPRHPSWFAPEAERTLIANRVARVAADPAVVPEAARPGGWPGLKYHRLHGSPRIYDSSYPDEFLEGVKSRLSADADGAPTWCIFDNTAQGAATGNALDVLEGVRKGKPTAGG